MLSDLQDAISNVRLSDGDENDDMNDKESDKERDKERDMKSDDKCDVVNKVIFIDCTFKEL